MPVYMENLSSQLPLDQEGELFSDSLILRVWLKGDDENHKGISWRGQITHVSSGESLYIKDLEGIIVFLIHFLRTLGARISWGWRLLRWLLACNPYHQITAGVLDQSGNIEESCM